MTPRAYILPALLALALLPAAALAGSVTGTVRNGTTGQPAANQDVILIQLQGSMQPLGTYKTDGQGRFRIEDPAIGQSPMLLRVQYKGVNYHASLPPGTPAADIEIFEMTRDTSALDVATRFFAVQPNRTVLLVAEELNIHNHTRPPQSVFDEKGNFEFALPQGAELVQVSVSGPSGLPLVQGTMDRGKGRHAIAYPFRPGETTVRVSYQMPYESNRATIGTPSALRTKNVLIAAPPTMTISAPGFASRGTEQGWNLYGRGDMAANEALNFSVSGTAPPPPDAGDSRPEMGAGGAQAAANISVVPQRLDNVKWAIIAGLGMMLLMGAYFLARRSAPAAAAPARERGQDVRAAPRAADSGAAKVASVLAQAQEEARARLEEIKESLVRLEMRRQAGVVSEEEYQRERGQAEQRLREYLKS